LGYDILKKENEKEALEYFNAIYEDVIGDYLEIVEDREQPDFICKSPVGWVEARNPTPTSFLILTDREKVGFRASTQPTSLQA